MECVLPVGLVRNVSEYAATMSETVRSTVQDTVSASRRQGGGRGGEVRGPGERESRCVPAAVNIHV